MLLRASVTTVKNLSKFKGANVFPCSDMFFLKKNQLMHSQQTAEKIMFWDKIMTYSDRNLKLQYFFKQGDSLMCECT